MSENEKVYLLLKDMEWEPRYDGMVRYLMKRYGEGVSVDVLIKLDKLRMRPYSRDPKLGPQLFREMKKVMRKQLHKLRWQDYRGELPAEVKHEKPNPEFDKVRGYRFILMRLSKDNLKLLRKAMGVLDKKIYEVTPFDIASMSVGGLGRKSNVGHTYRLFLEDLQEKIHNALNNDPSDGRGILVPDSWGADYSLKKIGKSFLEDMDEFESRLSGTDLYVWKSRMGYKTAVLPQAEVAGKLGFSGEGMNLIKRKVNHLMGGSTRISPDRFYKKIIESGMANIFKELKDVEKAFGSRRNMLRALAAYIDIETSQLANCALPKKVPKDLLYDFFSWNPYPTSREDVLAELRKLLDLSADEAEVYLQSMVEHNYVKEDGDNVLPWDVRIHVAISHIMAAHPEGLTPFDVVDKIVDIGICKKYRRCDRINIDTSQNGTLYLSGDSIYRHKCFLKLTDDQIKQVVMDVKRTLRTSPYESIHLAMEYYGTLRKPAFDYYTVRYIVRNFGKEYGVYFYGTSMRDTVSLLPEVKPVNCKKAVLHLMRSANMPISLKSILSRAAICSRDTICSCLSKMVSDGEVVKLPDGNYVLEERADKFKKSK